MKFSAALNRPLARTAVVPLFVCCCVGLVGCQAEPSPDLQKATGPAEAENPVPGESPAATKDNDRDGDYLSRVTQLYEEAKASGQTTAANAAQWIAEVSQNATSIGASAAGSAGDQLQQLYLEAKRRGETSVSDAKQWAVEDFQKIGDWQYHIELISDDEPDKIAEKLNAMGAERWECFWVDRQPNVATRIYFKRPTRSYIQRLPYRDLIRLMPLPGAGGNDASEP